MKTIPLMEISQRLLMQEPCLTLMILVNILTPDSRTTPHHNMIALRAFSRCDFGI